MRTLDLFGDPGVAGSLDRRLTDLVPAHRLG